MNSEIAVLLQSAIAELFVGQSALLEDCTEVSKWKKTYTLVEVQGTTIVPRQDGTNDVDLILVTSEGNFDCFLAKEFHGGARLREIDFVSKHGHKNKGLYRALVDASSSTSDEKLEQWRKWRDCFYDLRNSLPGDTYFYGLEGI